MKLKIVLSGLLLLAVSGISTSAMAQKKLPKKEIGLQLYSVRSMLGSHVNPNAYNADNLSVLKKLAAMGYTTVEAAGYRDGQFYNTAPEVFKSNVEKAGMKFISSHAAKSLSKEELASGDFSESLAWWEDCIKAHQAAGVSYIVTPWLSVPNTVKDLETECRYLNEIGKLCQKYGIKYGYHNHAHEFQKVEDQVVMLDYMLEHTDPAYVFFEMDVYWIL